ncbi:MAG TPA: LamG-like jellyroll fold domain-containing protein [Blastocatellia bacterium]|nr:LamG-like jellyroll fold domain-containing protein [Blastocatellia bacterium]
MLLRLSSRGLIFIILSSLTYCALSLRMQSFAVTDNSLSLNGSGAYMSVPNSSSLNITGNITVEAWVKTNSTSQQGIVERYKTGAGNDGGYIIRLSGGYLQFFTLIHGSSFDYIQSSVTISTGSWHHVAGIFDGTQMRVYVDGVQRGSKSSTFAPGTGTNSLKIGARGDDGSNTFSGLIDEVRITAGVVYTSDFTPQRNLAALTETRGLWKFDGQTTADSSGNNNNGSLVNSPTYSTDVPNLHPTVSLTSPANNATFFAPANITLTANASDSDGTISKVEFFQGSTKLGEDTSSPYSIVWSNAPTGTYTLTAIATDDAGSTTTSDAVSINVLVAAGTIAGTVTAAGGSTAIASATIKIIQGASVIATTTSNSAGNYSVTNLDAGTYSVEASAAGYETSTQANISVTLGATSTVNFSMAVPITYVYDDLGRLVSVIDQSGNAATYNYDAVGNLLSISRQAAAQISLIRFTPGAGPVGTAVTIYGTGFSATASQNTVTFNGTTATVTASSPSLIVTAVPAGATTGTITVTSPAGTITSSTAFTVTSASPGAPTITSFTPTIGTPGTAVSISGTNFDATPANNRSTFNVVNSTISAATTTSLTTSVPQAGSGHISVSTAYGKAVSGADFYIPPSPYTAANVEFTGRMSVGTSGTATINTANKIGLMLFDGTINQHVSLYVSSGITSSLFIYSPDGTLLASADNAGGGYVLDPVTLPATGTYTILINAGGRTGSLTLALYDAPDVTGTITPGGASVTKATTVPGQNIRLTFSGTAGHKVSLQISSITFAQVGGVSIINPNGIVLFSTSLPPSSQFVDAQTLPVTGTYTILLDPYQANTGSATCTLYDATDVTGSISVGGSSVNVTIAVPGQSARYSFSGTTGQKVSLLISNRMINTNTVASVLKPDGTALATMTVSSSVAFLDTMTLPVNGTYTAVVDPLGTGTGTLTLALYDASDITGTITPGGSAVTVSAGNPGQNARLTFSGTAAQRLSLNISSVTIGSTTSVSLLKPDGTTLTSVTANSSAGGWIDATSLPVTGTYTILVDPFDLYTGNMTLTLYDVPADVSGTITVGGSSVSVTATTPGQNAQLTFSGTSGQQVTVSLTSNTLGNLPVTLFKPDGTILTSTSSGSSSFSLATQTLPTTGTYTILIDPRNANTGSVSVTVTSP